MSKVILKVEIDEETYKQIKGDSVYDNNNKIIISKSSSAYNALNAIINATPIPESDDAVNRQAVLKGEDMEEIIREMEVLRKQLMNSGKECYEHSAYGVDYAISIVLRYMRINENDVKQD